MPQLTAGEQMPDFELDLAFEGRKHAREIASEKKYTAFWVLRYLGCTLCNLDVHRISERYKEFEEKNIKPIIVLQSPKETVESELNQDEISVTLVCDPEEIIYHTLQIPVTATKEERMPKTEEGLERLAAKRAMVKARGIVHGKYEGQEQQLPAFFVTDHNLKVLYAHYAENSVDIPNVDEALELICKL